MDGGLLGMPAKPVARHGVSRGDDRPLIGDGGKKAKLVLKLKFPAALFAALVAVCWALPAAHAGAPRYAGMVIDANTGKVLYEASADEPRHPASLTKMMTLYIVFEEMRRGRLTASTQIPMTARGAAAAPSKLGLDAGETIAVSLAEHIGGSEAQFARRMTERARQLGMTGTTFRNASGLPDPGQITTARDMLTLALRLNDDFPDQFRLFSLRSFTYRGKTYRTHNTLMHNFEGMDGIKTGYTRDSGFNVVTSVRSKGLHLVGAVFGGSTAASRNSQMRFLLRRSLVDASTEKTRNAKPMLVAEPAPAAKPVKQAAKTVALATPPQASAWKTSVAAAKPMAVDPAPKPAKPRAEARQAPAPKVAEKPAEAPTAAPRETPVQIVSVKPVPMGSGTRKTDADGSAAGEVKVAAADPVPAVEAARARALDFSDLKEAAGTMAVPAQKPASAVLPARAPAPAAPAASTETVAAKTNRAPAASGRRPSTLNDQLAVLTEAPAPAVRPRPAAVTAALAPARPPSTLNAQASNLGFGQPARAEPWHVGAPVPEETATVNANGGYDVEIGIYATAEEADQRLAHAQGLSPALAGGTGLALPATGSKPLAYRARFTGLGQANANAACNDLRRQSLACRVTVSE
jgi:D-alanyl-D-alanine carboxypeptidase